MPEHILETLTAIVAQSLAAARDVWLELKAAVGPTIAPLVTLANDCWQAMAAAAAFAFAPLLERSAGFSTALQTARDSARTSLEPLTQGLLAWLSSTQQILNDQLDALTAFIASIDAVPDVLALTLVQSLDIMKSGGLPMWVLLVLGLVLWYALGCRLVLLSRFTGSSRLRIKRLIEHPERWYGGFLNHAARSAIEAREQANAVRGHREGFVTEALWDYRQMLGQYATTIKAIVIAAPLIGLLGTILGMIETFEALETLTVFSQSSSIAGGISQALLTTQMGLIVAIPGLLLGRMLDRRQRILTSQLLEIGKLTSMAPRS